MERFKITFLLVLLMSMACVHVNAYDIVVSNGGIPIYYNFTNNGTELSVTWQDGYPNNKYTGSVTIPSSVTDNQVIYPVTSIGDHAFLECSDLTSVTIPGSVTSIGVEAFSHSGLESVTIPGSVTSIGEDAFTCCYDLESIIVMNGNTMFDSRNNCNAIIKTETNELIVGCQSTTIPNTVTSIGDGAFYGCSGLASIKIPGNVTSIGDYAFWGCSGLRSVVSEIETPFAFGTGAFVYISNNCTLKVPAGTKAAYIAAGWTEDVFKGGILEEANIGGLWYELVSGTKEATVIRRTNYVYSGNIVIPETVNYNGASYSVTSIGDGAFLNCSGLTSVTIPGSVTSIGDEAFWGCSDLTSVTIPGSVTSIGEMAFYECSDLTSVVSEIETPFAFGSSAFSVISGNCTLTVPAGKKAAYIAAGWTEGVFKGGIIETHQSYTLNSLGKGTYCSEYDLDFTNVSGLRAYIISGFSPSAGKFVKTRVFEAPAGTGLYIEGTPEETYDIPFGATDFYYANLMKGITVASNVPTTENGYTNYILVADGNGGVWFAKSDGTGQLSANRAYVQIPSELALGRSFIGIIDEEEATGIDDVQTFDTWKSGGDYYNLNGQKTQSPTKGIYIKNGKKIIIH